MLSANRGNFTKIGALNAVIGIVSFFLAMLYVPKLNGETINAVAGVLATVAGILSGFSLAAITMLVGMTGNRVIKKLRENGLLSQLLHTLNLNSVLLVIVAVLSIASMMLGSFSVGVFDIEYSLDWVLLCISLSMMITLVGSFMSSWKKLSLIIGALSMT